MYTQCPECQLAFRVTVEVLRKAGGRVRCGGCSQAFSAIEHLSEELPRTASNADAAVAEPPQSDQADDDFTQKSKKLLETLNELAGDENVRIEDTGIEWRVLNEDEAAAFAGDDERHNQEPGATEPPGETESQAGDHLAVTGTQTPLDLAETPVEETPVADAPDERRYDDNTPLPDDFDDEEETPYVPPVETPERRSTDQHAEQTEFDTHQADLALDDDDWADLLEDSEPVAAEKLPLDALLTAAEAQQIADDSALLPELAAEAAGKLQPEDTDDAVELTSDVVADLEAIDGEPEAAADRATSNGAVAIPDDLDTQFNMQAEALGLDITHNEAPEATAENAEATGGSGSTSMRFVLTDRNGDAMDPASRNDEATDFDIDQSHDNQNGETTDLVSENGETTDLGIDQSLASQNDDATDLGIDQSQDSQNIDATDLDFDQNLDSQNNDTASSHADERRDDEDGDASGPDEDEIRGDEPERPSDSLDDAFEDDELSPDEEANIVEKLRESTGAFQRQIEAAQAALERGELDEYREPEKAGSAFVAGTDLSGDDTGDGTTGAIALEPLTDQAAKHAADVAVTESEHVVPPQTEEEKSVNMEIDKELLEAAAGARADDDTLSETMIRAGIDPSALDTENVESIVMEGEFVRAALDDEPIADMAKAADQQEAIAKFDDPELLADTYMLNKDRVHGGRRKTDPAGIRMIAAIVALALLLVAQYIHTSRETLATYGAFNQTIGPVYRALGRPVTPEWNVRGWRFETTRGSTGENGDVLTISSRIRNASDQPLPYPLVHVSLTDRWEEIVGSKILEPGEYLAGDLDPRRPVAAGDSFTAVIAIDTPSADATGFKLNVCYRVGPDRVRCATEDFKN